jgi:polyphenol oxidase
MSSPQTSPGLLTRDGVPVWTWAAFDRLPVDVAVTTRDGGVSTGEYASLNLGLHVEDDSDHVIENRRRAAAALRSELGDLVFCNQRHGCDVAVVGPPDRGRGTLDHGDAIPCDALVTGSSEVGLVVMVADCVPLVLHDPGAHVLGCVHAGWGGTTKRITTAAVEAMCGLGARPSSIVAGIGPAITADRYQVGEDVVDAALHCFGGDVEGIVRPDGTGRWTLDLWAANRRLLVEAGVRPGSIEVSTVGTGPGTPFFSDRAARPCGRFAALARLHPRGDR